MTMLPFAWTMEGHATASEARRKIKNPGTTTATREGKDHEMQTIIVRNGHGAYKESGCIPFSNEENYLWTPSWFLESDVISFGWPLANEFSSQRDSEFRAYFSNDTFQLW